MNTLSSNTLDKKLAAYTALAAATLAAPALPSSQAAFVYSGPISINVPGTTAGVYLNLVTGVSNIAPASAPGWDVNPFSGTSFSLFTGTGAGTNGGALGGLGAYVGTGTTYFNLALGTLINGASTFTGTGTATPNAGFPLSLNSSNNLFGFRFFNEATSAVDFGWMRVSLGATSGAQPRAIVEYGYDNAGAAVAAGVVPEPTTFALLGVVAAGALGVRALRRRKLA